jgi:hypothetical protein
MNASSACASAAPFAGVAALIDPQATDKTLLAFVHVDTAGWGKTTALMAIQRFSRG